MDGMRKQRVLPYSSSQAAQEPCSFSVGFLELQVIRARDPAVLISIRMYRTFKKRTLSPEAVTWDLQGVTTTSDR